MPLRGNPTSHVAPVAKLADDALAVGATSGCDLVAGVLGGIFAWLPPYPPDERSDDD